MLLAGVGADDPARSCSRTRRCSASRSWSPASCFTFGAYWIAATHGQGHGVSCGATEGFRRFINESEKERARFAERKNLFSEYLPYAIVFGATGKWAAAFAGLDDQPPDTSSWYIASTPFTFLAFSSAIDGFTVSTSGTLTSTPPSTSGSSGFSRRWVLRRWRRWRRRRQLVADVRRCRRRAARRRSGRGTPTARSRPCRRTATRSCPPRCASRACRRRVSGGGSAAG